MCSNDLSFGFLIGAGIVGLTWLLTAIAQKYTKGIADPGESS